MSLLSIPIHWTFILFGAEHGTGSKTSLTSSGLAQEGGASVAHNDGLSVAVECKKKGRGIMLALN